MSNKCRSLFWLPLKYLAPFSNGGRRLDFTSHCLNPLYQTLRAEIFSTQNHVVAGTSQHTDNVIKCIIFGKKKCENRLVFLQLEAQKLLVKHQLSSLS